MLDTNLCIRVLRDRPSHVRPRFNNHAEALCISTIVLTELLHGAAKSARADANRQAVEHFAARLQTLSDTTPGQIEAAYQLALGRSARPAEIEALSAYITQHGLANACRVIFNSNEFLFID